jgi:hypothetical protein
MLQNVLDHVRSPAATNVASAITLLILGYLDYYTGTDLGFFIFYFAPVAVATWYAGGVSGVFLGVASAVTWLLADWFSHHPYSWEGYRYWNAGILLLSFLIIALVVSRIRSALAVEQQLNVELSAALRNVKELKGLLPICASCRRIRNDKGYWEKLEHYVQRHTDAEFDYGICPECVSDLVGQPSSKPAVNE